MDAEVQALLNEAREIDINDQDVATVLLVSVQDELNDLRSRITSFEAHQPSSITPNATFTHAHASDPSHLHNQHHMTANTSDANVATDGAAYSDASIKSLSLAPTPPYTTANFPGVPSSGHTGPSSPMHGVMSPRFCRADSNSPEVQLLFTVERSDAINSSMHGSGDIVRCTIVPVSRKVLEGSGMRAQSAPSTSYNTIPQHAAHLQDLLAQQHSIYSELLALKPAIMSAQIAANNDGVGGASSTPFNSQSSPADLFRSPPPGGADKSDIGEHANKLFGSGTLSPLTLSFQTGAPDHLPEGSPTKTHAAHALASSPSKFYVPHGGASSSHLPTLPGEAPQGGLQGGVQVQSPRGAPQPGTSPQVGATCFPPRLELSKAPSIDSASELRFGSPRTRDQATADLQPMMVRAFLILQGHSICFASVGQRFESCEVCLLGI